MWQHCALFKRKKTFLIGGNVLNWHLQSPHQPPKPPVTVAAPASSSRAHNVVCRDKSALHSESLVIFITMRSWFHTGADRSRRLFDGWFAGLLQADCISCCQLCHFLMFPACWFQIKKHVKLKKKKTLDRTILYMTSVNNMGGLALFWIKCFCSSIINENGMRADQSQPWLDHLFCVENQDLSSLNALPYIWAWKGFEDFSINSLSSKFGKLAYS